MKIICVIPARYASTRLPGKPLADIAGKPMIVRVYERVLNAIKPAEVIAAVDDERVYEAVAKAGGKAIMTAKNHPTGTDRLAEVAQKCPDADVIINVQGDEPLIDPQIIDDLAQEFLNDEDLKMATVKTTMKEEEKAKPGNVKVITDKNGYALYFSRSLIPYPRDFLLQYAKMQPTPLEQTESLEQLRALENGYKIKVIATDKHFVGVDTKEDLEEVNKIYQEMEKNK